MTSCLLEKAEMEWAPPPSSRPIGTPQIFPLIFCPFGVTLEHQFIKLQNVEEKSALKSAHRTWAQKSAHQKSRAKICATKICAKNRFEHSVFFWKMEARKKKTICAKIAQNLSPNLEWHSVPSLVRFPFAQERYPLPRCGALTLGFSA